MKMQLDNRIGSVRLSNFFFSPLTFESCVQFRVIIVFNIIDFFSLTADEQCVRKWMSFELTLS